MNFDIDFTDSFINSSDGDFYKISKIMKDENEPEDWVLITDAIRGHVLIIFRRILSKYRL
jgi:hypothetical protein